METLHETADLSKFIARLCGELYAFLYLYKQSFSGEQPRALLLEVLWAYISKGIIFLMIIRMEIILVSV